MLGKKTFAMGLLITTACVFLLSSCGEDEDQGSRGTTLTMQLAFPTTSASQPEPLDVRQAAAASDFFAIKAYREADGKEIPILREEVTDGPEPDAKIVTIELDDNFIQGDSLFLIIGTGFREDASAILEFKKIEMDISIVKGEDNDLGHIEMETANTDCIDLDGDGRGIGNCGGPDCDEFDPDIHSDCHPTTTTTTTSHPSTTTTHPTTTTHKPTTTTTHPTTTTTTHPATTTTTRPTTTTTAPATTTTTMRPTTTTTAPTTTTTTMRPTTTTSTTSTTTTTRPTTTTTTTLPQVTYTNATKAIFDAKCTMCHAVGGQSPNLTNYTSVFSSRSRIRTAVSTGGSMVRYLTAQEAQTIINWINAGAPQ